MAFQLRDTLDADETTGTDARPDPGPAFAGPGTMLGPGVESFTARSSSRTRHLIAIGATAALAGACLYTFMVDPNTSSAYPQCPLKLLTNIDCPGCGGLRATNALLHGDLVGAADHNLLALVLLPIMAYMFGRWVLAQFDITVPTIRWPRVFAWLAPAVLIVFTVARNIPVEGLHWFNSGLN